MHKKPEVFLRDTLLSGGVFAFGVSSAFDAILAHKAGHKFLYVGGYAASALNGCPDMGILTQTEMFEHIRRISDAVPNAVLIADIDNGYGGIHNVRRTMRDLLTKTSIAAVHIEDQIIPKRCGHIAGKEVISEEEFIAKLRAAIDVRQELNHDCLIIARTDAFSASGGKKDSKTGGDIKEVVKRGLAYARAEADLVWCEFPDSNYISAMAFADGMKEFVPEFGLAFNVSPSFKWDNKDHIHLGELRSFGYRLLFSTYPSLVASAYAVYETAKSFLGDPVEALKKLQQKVEDTPAESIKKIVGVDKYQEIEMQYDPKAKSRIESTDGFKK